jgi:P-type Cu+ transporter
MVGTGVGASHGLLIKGGGAVLENMHAVDTVIFDKTGTLTTGKAVLNHWSCFLTRTSHKALLAGTSTPNHVRSKEDLLLWLAACAELQSEHPLGRAVVNAARTKWGGGDVITQGTQVQEFQVVPGAGVECLVSRPGWGSVWVRVGNQHWVTEGNNNGRKYQNSCIEMGEDQVLELRARGQIGVYVSIMLLEQDHQGVEDQGRTVIGVLGIVDPIKAEAKSAIAALQLMGIDVWMCSGDHCTTALAVARQLGIRDHHVVAGVKPVDKAELVSRLQGGQSTEHLSSNEEESLSLAATTNVVLHGNHAAQKKIAFVGDGINDAVALARADVGVAIGAGTEVALEAADIILVKSSLHDVVVAIHLSKTVFQRIRLNFAWAMGYNLLALPFAAGILYPFTSFRLPPEFAGLMMAFSSVSVVTSSLLLRRYQRPKILDDGTFEGSGGAWCPGRWSSCCCCFASIGYRAYQEVPSSLDEEQSTASTISLEMV